jgi:hypothetical protein
MLIRLRILFVIMVIVIDGCLMQYFLAATDGSGTKIERRIRG